MYLVYQLQPTMFHTGEVADGKQLAIAPRNPAGPCSLPTPNSPDSTLRCALAMRWLC